MHPTYVATIDGLLSASLESAHAAAKPGQERIGVISGTGHGDNARGIAACQGLRTKHGRKAHIFLVTTYTRLMVELDMIASAREIGVLDSGVPIKQVPNEALVHALRPRFDVLYDVRPYAAVTYFNLEKKGSQLRLALRAQQLANERLKPFLLTALGHPFEGWRLKFCPMTQFDILSQTLGVQVSEVDLMGAAAMKCAPLPDNCPNHLKRGKTSADRLFKGLEGQPYVVVHNGAGTESRTKVAPAPVFEAIVKALGKLGVMAVQVGQSPAKDGTETEPLIEGAVDRRGYRLPLTNQLLLKSLCLVSIEGFLPFMAAALGKPAAVLFGPTMPHIFGMRFPTSSGMEANLDLVRRDPETGRVRCPAGTCFWGGGWSTAEKWAWSCPLTEKHNPEYPHCMNFVEPKEAAGQVRALVGRLLAERPEAQE